MSDTVEGQPGHLEHEHSHDHAHHHQVGERFPFEKVRLLDSPERLSRQSPEVLVEAMALEAEARVLDLGAGTGLYGLAFLEQLPQAKLTAVDVEPRMLGVTLGRAIERGAAERVTLEEADLGGGAKGLELPEGGFELALLMNIYHELDERPALLKKIRAWLAPGGRLVICDWRADRETEVGPPAEHRVSVEAMQSDLQEAGFEPAQSLELYDAFATLVAPRGI